MRDASRRLKAWMQAVIVACASGSALAVPVTFSGSFDSFAPGPGYGADPAETWPGGLPVPPAEPEGTPLQGGVGGTLLNVIFNATNTSTVTFTLPGAGASASATIGIVELQEHFIDADELDDLQVVANFTLSSPVAGPLSVSAVGSAIAGPAPPVQGEGAKVADLVITWASVTVPFGAGGLFELSLATLTFDTSLLPPPFPSEGSVFNQTATITLLREPRTAAAPEPAVLMLLGVGFAGLALGRTRRSG